MGVGFKTQIQNHGHVDETMPYSQYVYRSVCMLSKFVLKLEAACICIPVVQ